jgi:hypothetical protein
MLYVCEELRINREWASIKTKQDDDDGWDPMVGQKFVQK